MKVLENFASLVGKTIAFSWIPGFSDTFVLATTDQEVMVAKFLIDYDDEFEGQKKIEILSKRRTIHYLESDKGRYAREQLGELGIFDLETFKKREKERLNKEAAERKMHKEEEERRTYERLKAKFEKGV